MPAGARLQPDLDDAGVRICRLRLTDS